MVSFEDLTRTLPPLLAGPLHGERAHKEMARTGRRFAFNHSSPPKQAAVLLLLFPKPEVPHFVLIERQGHPLDPHQNQISLPGGRQEPPETLQFTALRETNEEIGVPEENVQIAGSLSQVYVPVSNFLIAPFVGFAQATPAFVPQPSEVKSIFEVPVSHLLLAEKRKKKDLVVRGVSLKNVPYFDLNGQVVWGATAMILNEFAALIQRIAKHPPQ